MRQVKLNNGKLIGDNLKPYFIAEVNTSHFGDIEIAKKMADVIKKSGADCIKFQSWTTDTLYSDEYYKNNPIAKRFIKKLSFSENELLEISKYCEDINLDFSSTPYSNSEAYFLVNKCKAPFIKVASMDINNIPYLKYISQLNSAIILSTGMSSLEEIDNAVKVLESENVKNIVVFHCVSIYPAKPEIINLRNILMLRDKFPNVVIGYSDHTTGIDIGSSSVLFGSSVIEKHFTLDSSTIGMDNQMAIEENELNEMIMSINRIFQSIGDYERTLTDEETEMKFKMRRSLVYTKNLNTGHIISESDLIGKRPGDGIPISQYYEYIGKTLKKNVDNGNLLRLSDFQ